MDITERLGERGGREGGKRVSSRMDDIGRDRVGRK